MPVTQVDATAALLVIDLQNAVRAFPYTDPLPGVVANSALLAGEFRRRGMPVVFTTVEAKGAWRGRADAPVSLAAVADALPPDWAELMGELAVGEEDVLIAKAHWGAFTGTALAEILRARGVTQTVLTGVATAFGVESTARQASELGFHVTLATDAMTDMDARAQENSVERIFPRLGECGTTREVLARLPGRPGGR